MVILCHTSVICWNVSPVLAATQSYLLSTAAHWGEDVGAGLPKLGQLLIEPPPERVDNSESGEACTDGSAIDSVF